MDAARYGFWASDMSGEHLNRAVNKAGSIRLIPPYSPPYFSANGTSAMW